MKTQARFVAVVVVVLVLGLSSADAEPAKRLRFEAADGFELAANYFDPGRPGPGVLLLHQCNADKSMWDGVGPMLAEAGYHVLAMDYRGYADSTTSAVAIEGAGREARSRLHGFADDDVLVAFRKLVSLDGVDAEKVGTGGASCGGPRSIKLAGKVDGIQTMVFLSTFIDDELITASSPVARLPTLAIAAENDGRTTTSLQKLFETSKNSDSRLIIYKGKEHGHPLFRRDRRLEATLLNWYRDNLE